MSTISDKLCKTVHQYNKMPISEKDMEKLLEIAEDCCRVKNYVYQRYGGPSALSKLYPGYTIQNEMTESGLRAQLNLPSVYFYLAVFDALSDIKAQWTKVKAKIQKLIAQNESFTDEDKHYLRFLLNVSGAFEAVLNRKELSSAPLPAAIKKQQQDLAECVDTKKLHNYLCRQVRKHLVKLNTSRADGFSASERAYRYGDGGIYISIKEKRKRVFILLTDHNRYHSQIYLKLYPEQRKLEIHVPVNVAVRSNPNYIHQVGLSMGINTMLTTDQGHEYGIKFGQYHTEYAEWIREQAAVYCQNRNNNPGRKKYCRKKRRFEEQMHSYINHELNCFFQMEKPQVIYFPKLPKPKANGVNKKINHSLTIWPRGYIQKRLDQKCREQSVEFVEVFGKNISNECSQCGRIGRKEDGMFICQGCGFRIKERINAARNAKKRGLI